MNFMKSMQVFTPKQDFVGNLLGMGGGNTGGTFQAQSANIAKPVYNDQANQAYQQSQQGLDEQQAYLAALLGQNGVGNQQNVFSQQQALANQLQGVANGTGPNPALQQLQNTTGQNVANQAALMAGQRGAGANTGLIARQAGMQGAGIQQQAAGQGAALAAQQQLAGLGMLQGQQGQLANLATTQTNQGQNAISGFNQAAQSEQQNLLNSIAQNNNANVAMQSNLNSTNASIANTNAQGQQGVLGGLMNGVAPGLSILTNKLGGSSSSGKSTPGAVDGGGGSSSASTGNFSLNEAHGGMISRYAGGGDVQINGPQSNAGRFLFSSAPNQSSSGDTSMLPSTNASPNGAQAISSGLSNLIGPAVSIAAMAMEKGGNVSNASLKEGGGKVAAKSSQKAEVKGDSLKNDKVPAMLSEGEVVIPRHVMQSEDPVGNSAKFVAAVMARQGKRGRLA